MNAGEWGREKKKKKKKFREVNKKHCIYYREIGNFTALNIPSM
jgi:hypothetical protein